MCIYTYTYIYLCVYIYIYIYIYILYIFSSRVASVADGLSSRNRIIYHTMICYNIESYNVLSTILYHTTLCSEHDLGVTIKVGEWTSDEGKSARGSTARRTHLTANSFIHSALQLRRRGVRWRKRSANCSPRLQRGILGPILVLTLWISEGLTRA